jgi:tetratricopeptide (TPR) repeat protein
MSDHSIAFVPIPTWEYQSPELYKREIQIDIGLLAEALVYYDKLLVYPGNPHQFASFVRWFTQRGQINELIALLRDGTIQIYDYAFLINPLVHEGQFQLLNITDEVMSQPNSFARRYIENGLLVNEFPSHLEFDQFQKAIEDKVIEVKVDGFGPTVENATADFFNPKRNALLTQVYLDDSYALNGLGTPPEVEVIVRRRKYNGKIDVSWNFDVETVARALGIKGVDTRVSPGLALLTFPLSAAANANRYLLSAMKQHSDLYLPQPISFAIGDKLYEASIGQTQVAIEELQEDVDFPDLRLLLNQGEVGFEDVLLFRRKAVKFRKWLQDEAERDRRAFFAYHKELAEEANFTRGIRKSLRLFGAVGGGSALGTALGVAISPDPLIGGVAGSITGGVLTFLSQLGEGLMAGWKPVAFGNWYAARIMKIREAKETQQRFLTPLGLDRADRQAKNRQLKKVRRRNKRKRHR